MNKLEENEKYLEPIYDWQKSFWKKAIVKTPKEGVEMLYSYDTLVAYRLHDKLYVTSYYDYGQTTLKHVKEFINQQGFTNGTKQEIGYNYQLPSLKKLNKELFEGIE